MNEIVAVLLLLIAGAIFLVGYDGGFRFRAHDGDGDGKVQDGTIWERKKRKKKKCCSGKKNCCK